MSSSKTPVVTHADTPLTTTTNGARTSACTNSSETPAKSTPTSNITSTSSKTSNDAKLAVLTDLLADLSGPQRRDVIVSLPAADRATIARLVAAGAIE